MELLAAFLDATVRTATPLAMAALGEAVAERSGVINVGLEGVLIGGAFAAAVLGANAGITAGFVGAAASGVLLTALLGAFVLVLRADQIITGAAITAGALGLTAVLNRAFFGTGGAALTVPISPVLELPLLGSLPVVGPSFFQQTLPTYLLFPAVPAVWFLLFRTKAGLLLRASGDSPLAVVSAGYSPDKLRWLALILAGALGGLAGGTLVLSQVGTFAEGMSAGRGFIVLAIVALGRWHPMGVVLASLLFGSSTALQHLAQGAGLDLPYQAFLALPYVLTLVVLARVDREQRAPAWLGKKLVPDL
jgi:ABC-type uncharacterized transport system permease subunit